MEAHPRRRPEKNSAMDCAPENFCEGEADAGDGVGVAAGDANFV